MSTTETEQDLREKIAQIQGALEALVLSPSPVLYTPEGERRCVYCKNRVGLGEQAHAINCPWRMGRAALDALYRTERGEEAS